MDLEALTKIISLVCLFNYSIINAGVIALRFRDACNFDDHNIRSTDEIYAFVFVIIAFLSSFAAGL